ncbi:uncharacterized protein LOC135348049 [Halichondria panicea]|uniref:uncharacterized protein LOC135348049 n=1 Tax=Halichondria panicea TaxID=6063 RepID=UPI00312B8059
MADCKMNLRYLSLLLLLVAANQLANSMLTDDRSHCIGDSSSASNCSNQCTIGFKAVVERLVSNSTIRFCSGVIQISTLISFKNLTNITLLGQPESVLRCNDSNAGLEFVRVNGLTIENLQIEQCSAEHDSTTYTHNETSSNHFETTRLSSALYAVNCSNLHMDNVHITNSSGVGLVLYDVSGSVKVINSIFDYNTNNIIQHDKIFRGGGIYMELTVCTPGIYCTDFDNKTGNTRAQGNDYTFVNCTFEKNTAFFWGPKFIQYTKERKRLDHQGLGRGGGLSIQLNGESQFNTIIVRNSTFRQNKANWGAGVYIVVQDYSSHNTILLEDLTVEENVCPDYGGGGIDLGFNIAEVLNNTVNFDNCMFVSNQATYGGGVRVYSSRRSHSDLQNNIHFQDCKWISNKARFGSAIDIAPHVWEVLSSGFLPIPTFHNCEFRSNSAGPVEFFPGNGYTEYVNGRGAMMLTKFNVTFSGSIVFRDNSGTAIYLSSSTIVTRPQSVCDFTGNSGFQGGAISFVGFSALIVMEHNTFHFTKNNATRRGGALYAYNIDKHNFVSSRSCFIQYHGNIDSEREKNVTFTFTDNFAGYLVRNHSECYASGHAIFSPSLFTCIHACISISLNCDSTCINHRDQRNTFKCVGEFIFKGPDIKCQVSTSGGKFLLGESRHIDQKFFKFYPGREIELPISVQNDFGQKINAVYYATIENRNKSNIRINQPYTYISNRKMRLHGEPGSKGVLRLQKLGYREIMLDMNVKLLECPPGYVFDDVDTDIDGKANDKCVCSSYVARAAFEPIKECKRSSFRALLQKGYWFGFHNETFEYGYCPSGYCSNTFNQTLLLPSSKEHLSQVVCGNYRTGRLCGECTSNFSVLYHGTSYHCGSNESCDYGWFLYIISELLPLTILFVLATLFNVSFTSGAINGFIWFAQVIHSFPVTGKSFVIFPDPVFYLYTISRMIYNMFNFDFFSHNKLSFCLWAGATTMDLLVFKFVTVVYVIILVCLTVALTKYCNILQKYQCFRHSTFRSYIIHGLSSVLVIVFSQCISVSCQILEIGNVMGKGNMFHGYAVFRQGNLKPFSGGHIKYAVVAVLCMVIMTVPTLLLLIYPLCFKVLNILRCSDTNPVAKVFFHVPYAKLKPFLDSFQSCFKDHCRVFAGMYFLYRVLIILTIIFPRLTQRYMMLDVFLTTFLLFHAIAQPYREHWHNILDGLLFFNLIVVNKISWFNYDYINPTTGTSDDSTIPFTSTLLVIVMNIPLFYIITYIIVNLVRKIKKRRTVGILDPIGLSGENNMYDFELTNREEDSDSDENSMEYRPFGKDHK